MANGVVARWALVLATALSQPCFAANTNTVVLHLKNGDQLTGEVLSEDRDYIVLSTTWNVAISIPKAEIQNQVALEPAREETGKTAANIPPKPAELGVASAPTKVPKRWKWDLKLGTDIISGAKDREIYYGQTSLLYSRSYESNPKKFLRNRIEYRVDYGETDYQVSANRMVGAEKLDFDLFDDFYGYMALGAGYDTVRKIEYQYEAGPGLGYHLITQRTLALDTETGLNYQYREGLNGAPNREALQLRLGQDVTWELLPKITLSENVAFLPFLNELGEYQVRAEGNLGFGIVRHLSLNLTVLNLYDTLPAPGVPNNDFQFRSSLGVNF